MARWRRRRDQSREDAPGAQPNGEPVVYYIGVIDILTAWTFAKTMEHLFKTLTHPHKPLAHSCVPPISYANRFERHLRSWID